MFSKCEFWLIFVAFLGPITFGDYIQVKPKKIEVVKNWPRPLSPLYIQCFLGLIGYYRRFVEGFLSIAFPLTTLTQKMLKFLWSEACEKSCQDLEDRLTLAPILTLSEGSNIDESRGTDPMSASGPDYSWFNGWTTSRSRTDCRCTCCPYGSRDCRWSAELP